MWENFVSAIAEINIISKARTFCHVLIGRKTELRKGETKLTEGDPQGPLTGMNRLLEVQ